MTRLRIFHRFIILGFLLLSLALIRLQIIQYNRYQQLSQSNRIRILPQSASRGRILDRNNVVLASNTVSYNIVILPQKRQYPEEQIARLARILSVPEEKLKSKFMKEYTVPFVPILLSEDISLDEAVAIGQLKYDLPGVIIQVVSKRKYPLGNVASHVLGYLSRIDAWRLERLKEYGYKVQDLVGYSGIEEVYDYVLRPVEGGMQVEVDSKGRLSRVLGFKSARKGKDVQLTIDLRLQNIIHNNLQEKTGCVIVLNPDNGEILALESHPNFDPGIFQDASSLSRNEVLNDPDAPLFNRALSGLYSPGSVFKLIVAAAGLEKNKININTTFNCTKNMKIGDRQFSCWGLHNQENVVEAIADSCNLFFYNLGLRLGPQSINEYAGKFGLGQRTGVEFNGEAAGYLPYSLWERIKRRRYWFTGDTANFSIGQGQLLVTPLQVARVTAAFVNGGRLIKPKLLKSIRDENAILNSPPSQIINLPISEENLRIIKKGMVGAVKRPGGTAHVLSDLKTSVAGKTGSVQVSSGQAHGWFVGYCPVDKPRFVICVLLEHVGSGYHSCLMAKGIIQQMIEEGLL